MIPHKTCVILDKHAARNNDSDYSNQCACSDKPGTAQIIDMPASFHNGACGFCFVDGHAEIHKWRGSKIKNSRVHYVMMPLPVGAAGDSWVDVSWMAENSTVPKKERTRLFRARVGL